VKTVHAINQGQRWTIWSVLVMMVLIAPELSVRPPTQRWLHACVITCLEMLTVCRPQVTQL